MSGYQTPGNKADVIEEVSITGSISDIIELYAILYDKKVKAVKPEDVYMAVNKVFGLQKGSGNNYETIQKQIPS